MRKHREIYLHSIWMSVQCIRTSVQCIQAKTTWLPTLSETTLPVLWLGVRQSNSIASCTTLGRCNLSGYSKLRRDWLSRVPCNECSQSLDCHVSSIVIIWRSATIVQVVLLIAFCWWQHICISRVLFANKLKLHKREKWTSDVIKSCIWNIFFFINRLEICFPHLLNI